MPIRYTDFTSSNIERTDFVVRNRRPTVFELLLVLVFAIALSVILPSMVFDKMTLTFWLSLMLSIAGWYVITGIVRSRDLVLATEFQNALFASALGFNNKFCLIIKREGNIVYMDNGFQKMFPELVKERVVSIVGMLRHGKVEVGDKDKIFAAISRGIYDKIIFEIRDNNGLPAKIVMSFEPIIRPSGFILLRGRDFVEKRANSNASAELSVNNQVNPLLSKTSITLFAYVMDRMNIGVYMADPAGVIIYANRLVEQWLSYYEMEMISAKIALKDILTKGDSGPDTMIPENFEGEASLRKKDGGLVKAFITQKIIVDDDQRTLGCVAMINRKLETDPSIKKALW